MALLSFFRDRDVKPAWQFQTVGDLWRIFFAGEGRIVGEDRDQHTKSVSFFCIDEQTGAVLWKGIRLDEPWWSGIETVEGGIVYLHKYAKPDLPQHQGIIALDLETGRLLWKNEKLQFLFIAGGKLYASRDYFERRAYFELHPLTGEILQEFSEEEQVISLRRDQESATSNDVMFPQIFDTDLPEHERVHEAIRAECDPSLVAGSIELIHHENLLFFNYHWKKTRTSLDQPALENRLRVVDTRRKKVIFSDILNEHVLNPVPDSFLLKGGNLFYIKNKNTLVAVRLAALLKKSS
jgi:hypothetical protein